MKKRMVLIVILFSLLGYLIFSERNAWYYIYKKMMDRKTTADAIEIYGPAAEKRLAQFFGSADIGFPPRKVAFMAIKEDKVLELWAQDDKNWSLIKHYKILGASGSLGPKKREGDRQVPEGIYNIVGLNPNSSYHLSMKLNYPNNFDKLWAEKEGRKNPGSDIFIHGKDASIGCLAMGDPAIEEMFYLVYKTGVKNSIVIIAPQDPRLKPLMPPENSPPWVSELYSNIQFAFLAIAR